MIKMGSRGLIIDGPTERVNPGLTYTEFTIDGGTVVISNTILAELVDLIIFDRNRRDSEYDFSAFLEEQHNYAKMYEKGTLKRL